MVDDESKIAEKYEALRDVMDEQVRRMWAASEARALGIRRGQHRGASGWLDPPDDHCGNEGIG